MRKDSFFRGEGGGGGVLVVSRIGIRAFWFQSVLSRVQEFNGLFFGVLGCKVYQCMGR